MSYGLLICCVEIIVRKERDFETEKLRRGRYKELGEEIREMLTKGNLQSSKIPINPCHEMLDVLKALLQCKITGLLQPVLIL